MYVVFWSKEFKVMYQRDLEVKSMMCTSLASCRMLLKLKKTVCCVTVFVQFSNLHTFYLLVLCLSCAVVLLDVQPSTSGHRARLHSASKRSNTPTGRCSSSDGKHVHFSPLLANLLKQEDPAHTRADCHQD